MPMNMLRLPMAAPPPPHTRCLASSAAASTPPLRRIAKRRPRPSRLPTTYISADPANFRRMVHQDPFRVVTSWYQSLVLLLWKYVNKKLDYVLKRLEKLDILEYKLGFID
uniref:VQ domain-containing protein n=1 Tax=Leersia perrieri TaxID=77586 RepID=A0A0D9XNQ0_9ORYZ